MDDTVKRGESIASKTMSMITLMAGLLMGLSGYIFSVWKSPAPLTNKNLAAIFGCLYILGNLLYIINNIITNKYYPIGSQPQAFTNDLLYDYDDVSRDKILLLMYLNETEEYNWRIGNNETLNRRRWRRYRISVYLFLFLPFVLVIVYSVLKWIRRGE